MNENSDDFIRTSLNIYQKHIDYLNKINPGNQSAALRQSIDKLIQYDKQRTKREFLDRFKDNLVIVSIGMIFLLFGMVSNDILVNITALGIGIFFSVYGLVTIRVRK